MIVSQYTHTHTETLHYLIISMFKRISVCKQSMLACKAGRKTRQGGKWVYIDFTICHFHPLTPKAPSPSARNWFVNKVYSLRLIFSPAYFWIEEGITFHVLNKSPYVPPVQESNILVLGKCDFPNSSRPFTAITSIVSGSWNVIGRVQRTI